MNKGLISFCMALLLSIAGKITAQSIITQWNFNSSPADGSSTSGSLIPGTGSGSLIGIGTVGLSFLAGSPGDPAPTDNTALTTDPYPSVSAGNRTSGIQFAVSTVGYKAITLSFDVRHTNTAANRLAIQYTTDITAGTPVWTTITSIIHPSAFGGSFIVGRTVDASAITGLDNNPNAGFRIVTEFNTPAVAPTQYSPTGSASTYSTATGSIRFDMLTVKGVSLSCPATQANSFGVQYLNADSAIISFNRGSGDGVLVLAKQGSAVDAAPAAAATYTGNPVFGSGSQIGTGNFVVFRDTYTRSGLWKQLITGLTPGIKYHFAIYEFNQGSGSNCYLEPPLRDSLVANSTLLKPGDMLLTGFDNSTSGGADKFYLLNVVDIKPGTRFSLVNSRFEAGAAAGSRTLRWGGDGSDPFQDPGITRITYNGTLAVPAGSILSFEQNLSTVSNIQLNGSASSLFSLSSSGWGITAEASGPDQLYIVQGDFTASGLAGFDRYNTLKGKVIHGTTFGRNWVPLTAAVDGSNSPASRESRIPPEITCITNTFLTGYGFVYYNSSSPRNGDKRNTVVNITTSTNWTNGAGGTTLDVPEPGFFSPAFVIASWQNPGSGSWVGSNADWFECLNWEEAFVPDSTIHTIISGGIVDPAIDSASVNAATYGGRARTNDLSISGGKNLQFANTTKSDVLYIDGKLSLDNGAITVSSTSAPGKDTILLREDLSTGSGASFIPALSLFTFNGNKTQSVSNTGILSFYDLVMNNPFGITAGGNHLDVQGKLYLTSGHISTTGASNAVRLTNGTVNNIVSPVNLYGNTNQGYEKSFVNGRFRRNFLGLSTQSVLPVGKISGTDTLFAPVWVQMPTPGNVNILAEYFKQSPPNQFNVENPPIDHISRLEYWELSSDGSGAADDANITLSWRPLSEVTNIANYQDSIGVGHYTDFGTGTKWNLERDLALANITSGSSGYGTVTTNRLVASFSPFTLASRTAGILLPLRWLDWYAMAEKDRVNLYWQVSEEKNLKEYEIERSRDGIRFEKWATVASLNKTGNWTYSATDRSPAAGWNYYRLKVVDNQDKYYYSRVIRVWFGTNRELLVYPNPAATSLFVQLPDGDGSGYELEILDATGRIWTRTRPASKNFRLNISGLPNGMYYIRHRNNERLYVQKFIKE